MNKKTKYLIIMRHFAAYRIVVVIWSPKTTRSGSRSIAH